MMLKEHFVEQYGVPKWTAGKGGSGGAIQQYLIAQLYPGLPDAIQPQVSFLETIMFAVGTREIGAVQVGRDVNPHSAAHS